MQKQRLTFFSKPMKFVNESDNLLGMSRQSLQEYLQAIGEKPYRAQQLIKWIHARGVIDFEHMSDISKQLRAALTEKCVITLPKIVKDHISQDGTRKWLMAVPGGSLIETVLIPEKNRATLCISSQIGCALNCTFCSTARQGYQRNLTASEIIGQLWLARSLVEQKITNVVFMGMGEPLLNFDAVKEAAAIMRDEHGYGLPRRRVTVSTSGVIPAMEKLVSEMDVALAVSLHAPNDKLRDVLVPINKKYNIKQLMAACNQYATNNKQNFVTMEYVMLRGVNDSLEHARELAKLLAPVKCKVNLIPFNPFPGAPYQCSDLGHIKRFSKILSDKRIVCTTRTTRGDDIAAACGQLAGKVLDKTKRSSTYSKKEVA